MARVDRYEAQRRRLGLGRKYAKTPQAKAQEKKREKIVAKYAKSAKAQKQREASARRTGRSVTSTYKTPAGKTVTITTDPSGRTTQTTEGKTQTLAKAAVQEPKPVTTKTPVRKTATQKLRESYSAYGLKDPYASAREELKPVPKGMTRQTAVLYQRFTPGGGQYVVYDQPKARKTVTAPQPMRGRGGVISAAGPGLIAATEVGRRREQEYYEFGGERFGPSPKETFGYQRPAPITAIGRADVGVSKFIGRLPKFDVEAGKVPFTEAFKGTRLEPIRTVARRGEKFYTEKTDPLRRYGEAYVKEFRERPVTQAAMFAGVTAATFGIGTGLTLMGGTVGKGLRVAATAVGLGVAGETVYEAGKRVYRAPKGKRADIAGRVSAQLTPVAGGVIAGGVLTKTYAPSAKEFVTTRARYYKHTGEVIFGRLPLEVKAPTFKYQLLRRSGEMVFSREGVPIGQQTKLLPTGDVRSAYYGQQARYTPPSLAVKGYKAKTYPGTFVDKPIGKGDIRYWQAKYGYKFSLTKTPKAKPYKKPKLIGFPYDKKGQIVIQKPRLRKPETQFQWEKTDIRYRIPKFKPLGVKTVSRVKPPAYAVKTLFGLQKDVTNVLGKATLPKQKLVQLKAMERVPLRETLQIKTPITEQIRIQEPARVQRTLVGRRTVTDVVPRVPVIPKLDGPPPPPPRPKKPKKDKAPKPLLPKFEFGLMGGFGKIKGLKAKRRFRYQPSLVAVSKGIYGMKPKKITGLEVRKIRVRY